MNVVLVVAEDRAICESLRAALPESDLLLFENGLAQGLRRMISLKPDAIIVDDGPQLGAPAVARIRAASPGTPVIALSSRGDAETLASYTLAGARATLPKPFSCDQLRAAVSVATPRNDDDARLERLLSRGAEPAIPNVGRHQTAIRWLSRITGQIKDPLRISQSLTDAVSDVFDAVRCSVLLDEGGRVRIVASSGLTEVIRDQVNLEFASGLMRWFEENPCLFDRNASGADPRAVKEMQILGGRLAVPMMTNGRVCGALVMGEKASGPDYSAEERELFTVMARCASIAFENASLYETVTSQQSRVDAILGNVTAGVVVVHPDRSISMMNRSAERILQVRAVDALGRSVQRLGSGFADVVLRTLADGKARLRQQVRDPAIDAVLGLSVTPMGEEGVVVIFSKLPEATARHEDIAYSPFWEYLASRVAQEIKNPMVAINTFAQLLPRKYDSEDFREAFGDVVQKEVSRINNVVDTLFEFARHPRLAMRQANVNDTVGNVLRSFEDELAARSIKLETQWTTDKADADMDAVFFSQALHNVVQNSIEAMPDGGRLKVSTRVNGDGVEVVVADSGPGISEQDASLLFTPFFSTKEQGMGLGLTIASRIMRQHNGEVRLVPDPEAGAAFALRIPNNHKTNK